MKIIFLIIALLSTSFWLSGQDIIIRNNGEKIDCKVFNIDSARVYYVTDGLKYKTSLPKSDIRKIKYEFYKRDSTQINSFKEVFKIERSITLGILEGGGSLFGYDFELRFSNFIGLQVGAGYKGYGAGLDIHFKPTIKSSFISFQYWHQGFDKSFTQSLIGPNFVFRGREWFTFQIGLGRALEKGPAWPENKKQSPVMLTYAIGGYIPF
jgi:hypothetical protein